MNYWLVKSEPESYSWDTFVKEKRAAWTGVRNFQARNNLRAMKRGDLVFFYHSGEDKDIVGLARVDKDAYPDPTAKEGDWSCVDLVPVKALTKSVTLAQIKSDKAFADMQLVKLARISVTTVGEAHFKRVLTLAETKL
jgi:predicted RNA-binding protein with PUA-like domain